MFINKPTPKINKEGKSVFVVEVSFNTSEKALNWYYHRMLELKLYRQQIAKENKKEGK